LTDISEGMLEVARAKLAAEGVGDRVDVLRLDIGDMGELPDGHFDLSMAQGDPLSYCDDPGPAVAELARVTRTGGHVIGSVDSRIQAMRMMASGDWDAAERVLETGAMAWGAEDDGTAFPIHGFTVAELGGMFAGCGLRVVRVVGKPVFFGRLPEEARRRILASEEELARLLDLEVRFANDPGWAGSGSHFEMVGIKE
jgi:SAM-dependent methyltransferase